MTNSNNTSAIDTRRLANELKRYRQAHDLSLEDLGFSKSTLSRIERCIGVLDMDNLLLLADRLHQPVDAFFNCNSSKVVHYSDAPLKDRIAAILYTDDSLSYTAKNILADLMSAAIQEAADA